VGTRNAWKCRSGDTYDFGVVSDEKVVRVPTLRSSWKPDVRRPGRRGIADSRKCIQNYASWSCELGFRSFIVAVVTGLATVAGAGSAPAAQVWPRLSGDAADPRCQQAHRLSVAAFRSSNAALSWPVAPPSNLGSRFVLHRSAIDISGGNGLVPEGRLFSVVGAAEGSDRVLWAVEATDGKRLAVLEEPVGWRGDLYSVFLLEASVQPEALLGPASRGRGDTGKLKPFIEEKWAPPLVLRSDTQHVLWLIDFDPFQYVGDWRVYTFDGGEVRLSCRLAFHPPMRTNLTFLPPSVRRWAALLDGAIGPGEDEGTLQPTARIRFAAGNAWANASVRPWALVASPYNSTEEVEVGLAKWAAASAARKALLRKLQAGRPAAQHDLAVYYGAKFGLAPAQARKASAYVLDYLLRSSLVFHVDGGRVDRPGTTNPWPLDIH
jgi:hypothetical protein